MSFLLLITITLLAITTSTKASSKPTMDRWNDYISISTKQCDHQKEEECLFIKFGKPPECTESIVIKPHTITDEVISIWSPYTEDERHPYHFYHYKLSDAKKFQFKRVSYPMPVFFKFTLPKYRPQALINLIHQREIKPYPWSKPLAPSIPCGLEDPSSLFLKAIKKTPLKILTKKKSCNVEYIVVDGESYFGGSTVSTIYNPGTSGLYTFYEGMRIKDDVTDDSIILREGCVLYMKGNVKNEWRLYKLMGFDRHKKNAIFREVFKDGKAHTHETIETLQMYYLLGKTELYTYQDFVTKCKAGNVALDKDKEKKPCFDEEVKDAMKYGMDNFYKYDNLYEDELYDDEEWNEFEDENEYYEDTYDDTYFYDDLYEYLWNLIEKIRN